MWFVYEYTLAIIALRSVISLSSTWPIVAKKRTTHVHYFLRSFIHLFFLLYDNNNSFRVHKKHARIYLGFTKAEPRIKQFASLCASVDVLYAIIVFPVNMSE